jgi:lysophospholipase L1-like esterase
MAQQPLPSRLRIASLFLLVSVSLVSACADDGGDTEPSAPGPSGGEVVTGGANPATTGAVDAGAAARDSGTPGATLGAGQPNATPDANGSSAIADTGAPNAAGEAGTTEGDPSGMEAGTPGEGSPEQRPDQGEGDGQDVITIGDSWMNLNDTVGIQQSLEKVSGRDYRNFGVPGTKLLDEVIPNQYETAKKQGPVKTVIMTGGGNDILQEILIPCVDTNFDNDSKCRDQIDRVAARLKTFWEEMSKDGVVDVLLVGYSKKTNPLNLGTTSKSIEYSAMKIQPLCDMVPEPLRCTTLDSDKEVPSLKTRGDGIHPDDASYDAIGAAVWKLMQDKGMRR